MLFKRVIPCLLLKGEGLVKTIKFKDPKYVGDPINAVRIFNEKEVDELIFLDITATTEGREPRYDLIEKIASECFMPLGYGGGISSVEEAKRILEIGVEKVIINSSAYKDPELIAKLADKFGSQSVIIAIDVKKGMFGKWSVWSHSGSKKEPYDVVTWAQKAVGLGAGEIFLNSIDRDGTMSGYDIDLLKKVTDSLSVPVVACGGAGKIEDFKEAIHKGGASAVAAGSFFVFHGKHRAVLISYPSQEMIESIIGDRWNEQ